MLARFKWARFKSLIAQLFSREPSWEQANLRAWWGGEYYSFRGDPSTETSTFLKEVLEERLRRNKWAKCSICKAPLFEAGLSDEAIETHYADHRREKWLCSEITSDMLNGSVG
jgi:hypothetical protein